MFNLLVTSFAQLIIDTWAVMGLLTYGTGLNAGELFNYAWSWIKYLGGWAIYVLILVGVFLLGIVYLIFVCVRRIRKGLHRSANGGSAAAGQRPPIR